MFTNFPKKIAILGYASDLVGSWDPDSCAAGLPGSEEAVVYASAELAKRGMTVHVYINPPMISKWRLADANPRWYTEDSWENLDNNNKYDLVLLWRMYHVQRAKKRTNIVFFWAHDSPNLSQKITYPKEFDVYLLLSKHHLAQYAKSANNFSELKIAVTGNGYIAEQFTKPASFTNKYSIGYFSNYSRGLALLINIWPEIKEKFPLAELHICYGRQTWNTMDKRLFDDLITKIEKYKDLGVIEHGKLGHDKLAEVMQSISVWAYPCIDYGETFCITAIKCQAAGMIPVTTRIAALNETVHIDAPSIPSISNNDDVDNYKNLLIKTLENIDDNTLYDRNTYINWAKLFTWEKCIDKWISLYQICKK
jgi:glycosyltransferase involved in cell wall biosynthesis